MLLTVAAVRDRVGILVRRSLKLSFASRKSSLRSQTPKGSLRAQPAGGLANEHARVCANKDYRRTAGQMRITRTRTTTAECGRRAAMVEQKDGAEDPELSERVMEASGRASLRPTSTTTRRTPRWPSARIFTR